MWSPHGTEGWYIGPAMVHYQCYTVIINKNNATQIIDMLEFFPCNYNMPNTSWADLAIWAVKDLIHVLCHLHLAGPYNFIGDAKLHALNALVDIFHMLLGVGVTEPKPT